MQLVILSYLVWCDQTAAFKTRGIFTLAQPILYCVYLYKLLGDIAVSKVGCYEGRTSIGEFTYADDLDLLAPSLRAAKHLLLRRELTGKKAQQIYHN